MITDPVKPNKNNFNITFSTKNKTKPNINFKKTINLNCIEKISSTNLKFTTIEKLVFKQIEIFNILISTYYYTNNIKNNISSRDKRSMNFGQLKLR